LEWIVFETEHSAPGSAGKVVELFAGVGGFLLGL
jgi:hypothetical protein